MADDGLHDLLLSRDKRFVWHGPHADIGAWPMRVQRHRRDHTVIIVTKWNVKITLFKALLRPTCYGGGNALNANASESMVLAGRTSGLCVFSGGLNGSPLNCE